MGYLVLGIVDLRGSLCPCHSGRAATRASLTNQPDTTRPESCPATDSLRVETQRPRCCQLRRHKAATHRTRVRARWACCLHLDQQEADRAVALERAVF